MTVGDDPDFILIAAGSVWTTAYQDDVISRVDPATNAVATIPAPSGLQGIAYDNGTFWVASYNDSQLLQVDAATGAVLVRQRTGPNPRDVLVAAGSVWVANQAAGTVSRVAGG
jgi:streptogramin lyase